VISVTFGESAVFVLGEDEGGFDDVADPGRTGGDVAQGSPVADQER
jgi:hypothetical protein